MKKLTKNKHSSSRLWKTRRRPYRGLGKTKNLFTRRTSKQASKPLHINGRVLLRHALWLAEATTYLISLPFLLLLCFTKELTTNVAKFTMHYLANLLLPKQQPLHIQSKPSIQSRPLQLPRHKPDLIAPTAHRQTHLQGRRYKVLRSPSAMGGVKKGSGYRCILGLSSYRGPKPG